MSDTIFVVMGRSQRNDDGARRVWLVCYERTYVAASTECAILNRLAAKMGLNDLETRDAELYSNRELRGFVWDHGATYTVRALGKNAWTEAN
jgi:hypothetical protein